MADSLIVIPPLSPSDTNPPLGPAILARAAERREMAIEVVDLNMQYLRLFRNPKVCERGQASQLVGDQGKDRLLLRHAHDHFIGSTGLLDSEPFAVPDGANPVLGMHYSFDNVERAIAYQSAGLVLARLSKSNPH